jgi:hypothetical protein
VQHLELDRVPQTMKRTREYPVHEPAPQARIAGLNTLTHAADKRTGMALSGVRRRNQQHVQLLQEVGLQLLGITIAQIRQKNPPVQHLGKGGGHVLVIAVGRRQKRAQDRARVMDQRVQLKAEIPTGLVLAPIGIFVPEKTNTAMADGLADRDGLAIHQVEFVRQGHQRLLQESADQGRQRVQSRQPLGVAGQERKGTREIVSDSLVGLQIARS